MKLLTISGLDGSGKSTQIQLLKDFLESRGKRVFYFHTSDFSIANKILGAKKDSSGKKVSVSRAGWLGIFLRKIALRIDLIRFKLLYKKLSNAGHDYILSDRYFYDTVINIEYLSLCHSGLDPESNPEILKPQKNIRAVYGARQVQNDKYHILKPDTAIYLQSNPENILQRERIPDQGLRYLQKKKELYDQSAVIFGMKIIDGNKNKDKIFEDIKNLVTGN